MDGPTMLTSDARYQLLAMYSAQHLRAVANRIIARTELPALHFSSLVWRGMWLPIIPPLLQSDSSNEFFQTTGFHYPSTSRLKSWLTPDNKGILDINSSGKLIYLAEFIEKDWHLHQQEPIWRKHPTNRLNGYAYNIIQILMYDKISDDYPTEYYRTIQYNLLDSTLKNKNLNNWINAYQNNSKDPFFVATLDLTRISNMKSTFLWQITLETRNGLYTTLSMEATPGSSHYSYAHPIRHKRVHSFIGYV